MKNYKIPYREADHGDFDAKWSPHEKVSGWWYITGYLSDPDEPEHLYSYPNMPTAGEIILRDSSGESRTLKVTGKSWFDRQWGPFRLTDPASHWEWFSLRFFDDEEVMLFAFPQHPYRDGTYIDKAGNRQRVRDYTYTPRDVVEVDGFEFSSGWDLVLPGIKDEHYEIRPIMDGQMNLAYFELLAEIIDPKGDRVGLCFVELLPGVRNPGKKISGKKLFSRV